MTDGAAACAHGVEVLDAEGSHVPATAFRIRLDWGGESASGRRPIVIDVAYRGAEPMRAAVRLRVDVPNVATPWWLIPGAFYGDNRPPQCLRIFPRFEAGVHDPQHMVSDSWAFRADRCATPAVFVWGESGGFALAADELSPLGMTGIGFAYDAAEHTASIHLTFPYREEPVTYFGSQSPLPPDVTTHLWQPGETVRLHCAGYELGTDRHAYAPILRELHAEGVDRAPVTAWFSVAEAADIAAEGLLRWHYDPDPGVLLETVGFDREVTGRDGNSVDRQAMHVGWVSGMPWAHALLVHGRRVGDTAQTDAASRVIDFICDNLTPQGTFWGTWYRSTGWTQSWTPVRHGLHARTLAEATLFLARTLGLNGVTAAHPNWVAAARSNLEAAAERQREDGNLGTLTHALTGDVLSWDGAGGLTWVAALAEAAPWDADGRYLNAAIRAGDYYAGFVDREYINGAPEDVDLAPTSEDGYAALMAYLALYRRTGTQRWLELARRSADWMLTFRYSYNVTFEPRTMLGAYGFGTRGGDQASASNQHLGAYGLICTDELHELSAALGDEYYARRADETLACFRQLLPGRDGEVNAYRGMITERYYQTNCFQPKGMLLTLSHAWSVGVLLLACEQELAAGRSGAPVA
jgi:hypothetical protein